MWHEKKKINKKNDCGWPAFTASGSEFITLFGKLYFYFTVRNCVHER